MAAATATLPLSKLLPFSAGVPERYVGPASRLVVQRGRRLILQPHTKVTIAGQRVAEDGAYFYQDSLAEM